jgi:hypothetical protein
VAKPRQNRLCGRACGHFKEIIMTEDGDVICNCEFFMGNRYCHNTLIYELVEFGVTPPAICRELDGIGYSWIHEGWTAKLKKTMFNVKDESESQHDRIMHNTYLPNIDPQYKYVAVIHSVPVPWVTRPVDGELTLGLDIQPEKLGKQTIAKIIRVKPESRAKVLVGNIIVKVNDEILASNKATLLPGKGFNQVLQAVKSSPKTSILKMDVCHSYTNDWLVRHTSRGRVPTNEVTE